MSDFITATFATLIILMLAGLSLRLFVWAFEWLWGGDTPEHTCCICGTRDYGVIRGEKFYCRACAEKEGVL